ncbi:hypothetical protein [Yokenella regensburgei]|uniref:hypothetical protein n=1 Tax=Yokenella regensburgei TaxID=158877 RepID=UPI0028A13302|nr:hypothetical protein [Yokenella regensburgei]
MMGASAMKVNQLVMSDVFGKQTRFGLHTPLLPLGPIMVCASDVWMQAGLAAAVREIAPARPIYAGSLVAEPGGPHHLNSVQFSVLLFWLPGLNYGLFTAVRHLVEVLPHCHDAATVLLLTKEPPGWLYRTLEKLAPQARTLLPRIQCLPDCLHPYQLQQALRGAATKDSVLLQNAGVQPRKPGLSLVELKVAEATLCGKSAQVQSEELGRPVRVVQRVRWTVMQKLGDLRVKNLGHAQRKMALRKRTLQTVMQSFAASDSLLKERSAKQRMELSIKR